MLLSYHESLSFVHAVKLIGAILHPLVYLVWPLTYCVWGWGREFFSSFPLSFHAFKDILSERCVCWLLTSPSLWLLTVKEISVAAFSTALYFIVDLNVVIFDIILLQNASIFITN